MEHFINDYIEPVFEKAEVKVTPIEKDDLLNIKVIDIYKNSKNARTIVKIKHLISDRLKIPIRTSINKVSDKVSSILRGEELITMELNKTQTTTIILSFNNKKMVQVISEIDNVFLNKITNS